MDNRSPGRTWRLGGWELSAVEVTDGLVRLGAIVGAAGVILTALRVTYVRVIDPLFDALRAIRVIVERELQPNGGYSIKDEVCKIRDWQARHDETHRADSAEIWAELSKLGLDRRHP